MQVMAVSCDIHRAAPAAHIGAEVEVDGLDRTFLDAGHTAPTVLGIMHPRLALVVAVDEAARADVDALATADASFLINAYAHKRPLLVLNRGKSCGPGRLRPSGS